MITNTKLTTLKEIETDLFRTLQQTYSDAFTQHLTEIAQIIVENRDKTRFPVEGKKKNDDGFFVRVNRSESKLLL